LGTARRVFASTTSAPAYSYDPYGNALQATAPVADFNYAGMFYHADSGLYLTHYRAYDPVPGRWLSRDPMGRQDDPTLGESPQPDQQAFVGGASMYIYANSSPLVYVDDDGLAPKDKAFGLPPDFWKWYHRKEKKSGDPDLGKDEAEKLYNDWCKEGRPAPDNKGRRRSNDPSPFVMPPPVFPLPGLRGRPMVPGFVGPGTFQLLQLN
jgi:RHS repeat-associated protein